MIGRHQDNTGCIVGIKRTMEIKREINLHPRHRIEGSDEENTEYVEQRSKRSTFKRANVYSRLGRANHPNYEEEQERGEEESGANRSWRSAPKRAQAKSRMDYANRIVNPRVEYEDEQEQEEEDNGVDAFEALSYEEMMLIAASSDHVTRLGQDQNGVKDAYRQIVEKLIRRTGMICKDDMDKFQRKLLKRLVTDFRRQVVPRPQNYNAGGNLEEYEV